MGGMGVRMNAFNAAEAKAAKVVSRVANGSMGGMKKGTSFVLYGPIQKKTGRWIISACVVSTTPLSNCALL